MGYFNNPPSGLEIRVGLLLLDFFSALFYMRNVISIFDSLLRGVASVTFVSAQILLGVRALNYYGIKNCHQLADIMPVRSGYDYRERDPTRVH